MPVNDQTPDVTLVDSAGVEFGVQNGVAIPAGTPAILMAGSDGTNARVLSTSAGGVLNVSSLITGTVTVQGGAAHDAPVAGNPNLIAGRSSAGAPADVSGDGDATDIWVLRNGAQATVITAAGALIGGDAANGLDVDVTRMPAGMNPAALGQGTMAQSIRVVLPSDQSAITVTGTVTAANASVGANNAAIPTSSTQIGGSDGTNLQALRAFDLDSGGGTQYVLGANIRRTAAGGSAEMLGQTTMALSLPVAIASDQSVLGVVGAAAHDAAVSGNPVLIAGRSSAAAPTDVTADGEVVYAWRLRNGAAAAVLTAAGALIGGDAANGLDVDVTRMPTGMNPAALGQGTMAQSIRVVLPSDQSAITVTGTVTAANASVGANNAAIPTSSTQVGGSDGTNLQALRAFDLDSGAGAQYVLGANLRRSFSGGSLELLGQSTMSGSLPVAIASDQTALSVVGVVSNDSPVSGFPVLIAGRASAAAPTDVSADGDLVTAWRLRNGAAASVITAAGALIGGDATNGLDVDVTRDAPNPTITNTLDSNGETVTLAILSKRTVAMFWTNGGTYSGTLTLTVSFDGVNFFSAGLFYSTASSFLTTVVPAGATGNQRIALPPGATHVRVAATPYTSGSIDVTLTASNADVTLLSTSAIGSSLPTMASVAGFDIGPGVAVPRVFDADTGGGTQYVAGANLRISGGGGSIEAKGQQTMANSIPVTIASDQAESPVRGSLANGVQTTVDATVGGVQIVAANATRRGLIIQNTGSNNIRVGITGVTATTGMRLTAGATWTPSVVPTNAIFAIREGASNSTALAQETT